MVDDMNAGLLFAFELYRARYEDLLRQAEEGRLGNGARTTRSPMIRATTHRGRPATARSS